VADTKPFPLTTVLVQRSKHEVISVDVPAHEIEVLRAMYDTPELELVTIHGPAGGDADDPDTIELNPDKNAEFDRLKRRYHRVNAQNPVDLAFRGGARDLERYGFDGVRATGAARVQTPGSLVKKNKPAKVDETKKAEPKKAEPEKK
jgi:hypothetical protein